MQNEIDININSIKNIIENIKSTNFDDEDDKDDDKLKRQRKGSIKRSKKKKNNNDDDDDDDDGIDGDDGRDNDDKRGDATNDIANDDSDDVNGRSIKRKKAIKKSAASKKKNKAYRGTRGSGDVGADGEKRDADRDDNNDSSEERFLSVDGVRNGARWGGFVAV